MGCNATPLLPLSCFLTCTRLCLRHRNRQSAQGHVQRLGQRRHVQRPGLGGAARGCGPRGPAAGEALRACQRVPRRECATFHLSQGFLFTFSCCHSISSSPGKAQRNASSAFYCCAFLRPSDVVLAPKKSIMTPFSRGKYLEYARSPQEGH